MLSQPKQNLQDQIEDHNDILRGLNNSKESQSSDSEDDTGVRKDQKILIDLSSEENGTDIYKGLRSSLNEENDSKKKVVQIQNLLRRKKEHRRRVINILGFSYFL